MCWTSRRRLTTYGVGTAMADTRDLNARQIRNHSIVRDAGSMAILTKHVGEAGKQQGVLPNQATLLAPRHLHQPPPPLKKQNRKRKRRKIISSNKNIDRQKASQSAHRRMLNARASPVSAFSTISWVRSALGCRALVRLHNES